MDDLVAPDKCLYYTPNDTKPNERSQVDNPCGDNRNKIIFAHLSINSIRNKFDHLADFIKGKIYILIISESEIDDSFPDSQFFLDEYSTRYGLDRNRDGGGIVLFVHDGIPAKIISIKKLSTKSFLLELNLRKKEVAY